MACLRALNLPARYVSGYIRTYPLPGRPRLVGADASHAWVSVYCPGAGWLDVDPTNNLVPSDGHVTLAWGRDYGDVSPLRGLILGGRQHTLKVGVDLEPLSITVRWPNNCSVARRGRCVRCVKSLISYPSSNDNEFLTWSIGLTRNGRSMNTLTALQRAYGCRCNSAVFFLNSHCLRCDTPLGYEPELGQVISLSAGDEPGTWLLAGPNVPTRTQRSIDVARIWRRQRLATGSYQWRNPLRGASHVA